MGVGEVDEWMERQERRMMKKRERENRKKEKREKYKEVWKGVQEKVMGGGRARSGSGETTVVEEIIVEGDEDDHPNAQRQVSPSLSRTVSNERSESVSTTTAATGTPSSNRNTAGGASTDHPLWRRAFLASCTLFQRGYLGLRTAHILAARRQAEERVVIINEVYGREGAHDEPNRTPRVHGWGLGSFGLREREAHDRTRMVTERIDGTDSGVTVNGGIEADEGSTESMRRRREAHREDSDDDDEVARKKRTRINSGNKEASSMWWWGPLRRWRLQDSTVY